MKYSKPIEVIAERMRAKLHDGSSLYSRRLHGHVVSISSQVAALEKLAVSKSPMETEERHAVRLAEASKKLAASRQNAEKSVYRVVAEAYDDLNAQIAKKANIIPDQHASEVRAALRSMKEKDRQAALQQALEEGNGPIIAAITDAPQILTGINPEMAGRFREIVEERKAPELVAERSQILDHFDSTLAVLRTVDRSVSEGFDPEKLRKIEEAERNFQNASGSFESSFSEVPEG